MERLECFTSWKPSESTVFFEEVTDVIIDSFDANSEVNSVGGLVVQLECAAISDNDETSESIIKWGVADGAAIEFAFKLFWWVFSSQFHSLPMVWGGEYERYLRGGYEANLETLVCQVGRFDSENECSQKDLKVCLTSLLIISC